jgi:hypothetical protein
MTGQKVHKAEFVENNLEMAISKDFEPGEIRTGKEYCLFDDNVLYKGRCSLCGARYIPGDTNPVSRMLQAMGYAYAKRMLLKKGRIPEEYREHTTQLLANAQTRGFIKVE